MYKSDPLVSEIYNISTITDDNSIKTYNKVQDCGEYQNIKSPSTKIKINKKFAQYWKNIEKRFNCVGFCQTIYYDELGETVPFTKYLFSGFNRGSLPRKITTGNPGITASAFIMMYYNFLHTGFLRMHIAQ